MKLGFFRIPKITQKREGARFRSDFKKLQVSDSSQIRWMFKAAAAPKDDDEAGGGYLNAWWVFVHNEKLGVFNGWKNSRGGKF